MQNNETDEKLPIQIPCFVRELHQYVAVGNLNWFWNASFPIIIVLKKVNQVFEQNQVTYTDCTFVFLNS